MVGAAEMDPPLPSSRASARTGWTRSSGPRVAVALTAVVGGMVALQGPINSQLGKTIGTFQAAFFSFATGTDHPRVIAAMARGGSADQRGEVARAAVPDRRRARRVLRELGAGDRSARSAPAASLPRRSPASSRWA
jgi:hypothetical protein